jgi:outer membrane protein assembly factor BamB
VPDLRMPRPRRRPLHVAAVLGVVATTAVAVAVVPSGGAASAPRNWTVYHGTATGSGVAPGVRSVVTAAPAWRSATLDGKIYGEPLVLNGQVYVATENNRVYALSAATGRIAWSRRVGTPVAAAALPCGNITPTVGVTGTPVIDARRHEIFVVADESVGGHPHHVLVGLSTANGRVAMSRRVDPPGADPAALLQRTGLNLDAGHVVFGMGGNAGDCGAYRGRVVSVPESGGTPRFYTVDAAPGQREGAVWMGGAAPEVDSHGRIWAVAGNGSVGDSSQAYDHSDSVLELSPSLHLLSFFAPAAWADDNAQDADLAMAPALLANGKVVASGKSQHAYLLNGRRLGGIGHQLDTASVCGGDVAGGAAVVGTTVYLPCLSGPVALQTSARPIGLHVRWSANAGGGPPIVAANRVWTIGQDGVLYGLDPSTGAVRQRAQVGDVANHFPTPSVGAGLMLVAGANRVIAFRAIGG